MNENGMRLFVQGPRIRRAQWLAKFLAMFALLASSLLAVAQSEASPRDPYSVDVRPTLRALLEGEINQVPDDAKGWHRLDSPVRFSTAIFGESVVEVNLTSAHARTWSASFIGPDGARVKDPTEVTLLRGTVLRRQRNRAEGEARSEVQKVRGVIIEKGHRRTLHVYLQGEGASGITRYYRIAVTLHTVTGEISEHLSRAPEYALYGKLGNHGEPASARQVAAANRAGGAARITGGVPVTSEYLASPVTISALSADIAMEGDHRLYASLGSNAPAEIASIMNTVTGIYESDIGVTFSIVDTSVRTTAGPYPESMTDANELLEAFQAASLADGGRPSADVYHLMLGRDMAGDTVGLAYVGVVCYAPEYSYGLSQYFNAAITPPITAHELGHNFGGNHVGSGIMSAVLSDPLPSHFSSQSVTELSNHLSEYSDCLTTVDDAPPGDETPTPTPAPTDPAPTVSLRSSVRGTTFKAKIDLSEIADGCVITLRGSPTKSAASSGEAIFSVVPTATTILATATMRFETKGSTKVYLVAESACSERAAQYSPVRALTPSKLTARRAVRASSWLARLRALFAEVS